MDGKNFFGGVALTMLVASCQREPHQAPVIQPTAPPNQLTKAVDQPIPPTVLLPAISGHLYGYIDGTGKFKIAPQFTAARPFSHGMAAVRIGGTLLDYESPRSKFISDTAGRIGYIDSSGHFVINPIYTCARDFAANGVATVAKSKSSAPDGTPECAEWQAIDTNGKELFSEHLRQPKHLVVTFCRYQPTNTSKLRLLELRKTALPIALDEPGVAYRKSA